MAYTTIDDPSAHFQTALYTGDGGTQSITNDGNSDLQPDWLWIKERSSTSGHNVMDSSRGVGEHLFPNSTGAEESLDIVSSFNSDGWSTGASNAINQSSETYVAWQWKANGGSLTTNDASATSVGTIDSVYQANTTAGFSIVTYTGAAAADTAVAHGLGAVPNLIIVKDRDATKNWTIYHHSIGNDRSIKLNTTDAQTDSTDHWNNATPTSTVFYLGNYSHVNRADAFIAYCFTEVQGYSKFGGYTGNGSTDGPFIYTGFKPAWIMIKNLASGESWEMWDSARDPYNVLTKRLKADDTGAEVSSTFMDFVSNGVKHRNYSGGYNDTDESYIYMAFAEQPFVTSGGVPCTAR